MLTCWERAFSVTVGGVSLIADIGLISNVANRIGLFDKLYQIALISRDESAIALVERLEGNMIVIGQTREIYRSDKYPSIMDLVNKPIKEKEKVLKYMKSCKISSVAPAIVTDLIEPKIKFAELYSMNDGTYGWRSDLIYYVEKYDMELPEEFIQHVLSKCDL